MGTDVIDLTKTLHVRHTQNESALLSSGIFQITPPDHTTGHFIDLSDCGKIKILLADFPRFPPLQKLALHLSLVCDTSNLMTDRGLRRINPLNGNRKPSIRSVPKRLFVISHIIILPYSSYFVTHQNSVRLTFPSPGRKKMSPIISATCPIV